MTAPAAAAPVAIVADLREAREALRTAAALGLAVRLASPRGGVRYAGAAYYRALALELGEELVIDCDDAAGFVLEALRVGARDLVFRGEATVRRRLDALAREVDGRVRARLPGRAVRRREGETMAAALVRVARGRGGLPLPSGGE